MPIYNNKLTFECPTRAQVALTDALVKVINDHHKKSRDHLFHLCMIAYGLRTHNLSRSKTGAGGNAQGRSYKPEFREWYESNSLSDVYGTLANFTLYAMAGRLLNYVRWQIDEKYIARLPSSLTALYALSKIVWSQGESATPTSRKLFEKALIMPIKDGSKDHAFIHPHITRGEVEEWILRETVAKSAKKDSKISKKSNKHPIVLATIRVHQDLMKFAKVSGRKVVGPKIEDVESLESILRQTVSKFDNGKSKFIIESHLDEISADYKEAQFPDFGKKILEK